MQRGHARIWARRGRRAALGVARTARRSCPARQRDRRGERGRPRGGREEGEERGVSGRCPDARGRAGAGQTRGLARGAETGSLKCVARQRENRREEMCARQRNLSGRRGVWRRCCLVGRGHRVARTASQTRCRAWPERGQRWRAAVLLQRWEGRAREVGGGALMGGSGGGGSSAWALGRGRQGRERLRAYEHGIKEGGREGGKADGWGQGTTVREMKMLGGEELEGIDPYWREAERDCQYSQNRQISSLSSIDMNELGEEVK